MINLLKLLTFAFTTFCCSVFAQTGNVPGGGTGTGANVTVTSNSTSVTLNNGIVSVTIDKSSVNVTNYTYKGINLLAGGYRGGQLYWTWKSPALSGPGGPTSVYTLTTDPTTNGGNLAETRFHKPWDGTTANMPIDVDICYSLSRGNQGIYATAILNHPDTYPTAGTGEWRMAGYVGSTFNWLSVDSLRNKQMPYYNVDVASAVPWGGAPKEVTLWTTGIYANKYECKYDYSADYGTTDVWGWSSTTKKLGIWITAPSKEYYNGGPMKRELMCHVGPTILNVLNGGHFGMGGGFDVDAGVAIKKTYGPFLIYCNSVPTSTPNAWKALWEDAKAQVKAEQSAWPFSWFKDSAYVLNSGRGVVTGRLVINDTTTPNASAANSWVGISKTQSGHNDADFQLFGTPYQFWVKTDSAGRFAIPHVIADNGYNFYAFGAGSGVAGQLTLANYVKVTALDTTNLGDVVWTPDRVAPTVWEIGIPDRTASEFFHGKDWFTSNTYPDSNWAIFKNLPREFPNSVNYTVGTSNWATDWNFVQNNDNNVVYQTPPVWNVNFNLTKVPTGKSASVYVACAASFGAALILSVNGVNVTNPATGIPPPNPSDAMIRKGIHGAFGEVRFPFSPRLLKAGKNKISFSIRAAGGGTSGDVMYDYLRLEAFGTSLVDSTLPVQFLPLTAVKENDAVTLHWSTLTESNNKYFQILRSANGVDFTSIGTVSAVGNTTSATNYSFSDKSFSPLWNYYRIKQVDQLGKFTFSNTTSINIIQAASELGAYPNPSLSNLNLVFTSIKSGNVQYSITNTKGSVVRQQTINVNAGSNNKQVNTADLSSGLYWLNLYINGTIKATSFIKQ